MPSPKSRRRPQSLEQPWRLPLPEHLDPAQLSLDARSTRRGFLVGALALLLPAPALAARVSAARGLGLESEESLGAEEVSLFSREEPITSARTLEGRGRLLAARDAPRFNLVGLHWRGRGHVSFRTGRSGRGFGPWQKAECCESPDPDTGEGQTRAGWHLGKPAWTGTADRIQYRLVGEVRRLRAHFVWSPIRRGRRLAAAEAPFVIPRAEWGADEEIVRRGPLVAEHLQFAVVHHTAGRAPGSPDESAAILRAIQAFHVEANGWNDIGYNFLIDPFGQVFEGRGGGIEQNVVGAHARGFNSSSVGVALLGHYQRNEVAPEAREALIRMLAWRLDVGHVDPLTLLSFPSGGNRRFPASVPVTLRAVSGHRDTDFTVCPGKRLYEAVNSVAHEVAALGLPKLYEPRVAGRLGEPIQFTARLSEERPWSVTIADEAGNAIASGGGVGSTIDWTWDATGVAEGTFSYVVTAGDDVRPAVGTLSSAPVVEELPPPPPRPAGIPRRVPRWAWELHRWHSSPRVSRGKRPKAPRRPPKWYWTWRRWRLAHERYAHARRAARGV